MKSLSDTFPRLGAYVGEVYEAIRTQPMRKENGIDQSKFLPKACYHYTQACSGHDRRTRYEDRTAPAWNDFFLMELHKMDMQAPLLYGSLREHPLHPFFPSPKIEEILLSIRDRSRILIEGREQPQLEGFEEDDGNGNIILPVSLVLMKDKQAIDDLKRLIRSAIRRTQPEKISLKTRDRFGSEGFFYSRTRLDEEAYDEEESTRRMFKEYYASYK